MKKATLVLFLLMISLGAFSQTMTFTGVVNDTINDTPIKGAVIMAIRVPDHVLLGFTRSQADGSFKLTGVPMDTLRLVISHYKFDQKTYFIIGSEENKEINIPNVVLPDKATKLEEVIIYANKKPIFFRGDTLVYVADSFATRENAMVEDLLKNLPGLSVDDDGNIISQGRRISKVLVDGDEFFGSDPTIATRNLQASSVDEIEVYETEDENSGGNTEDKIKVLNIELKDSAKTGYFGKVAGSGGFNTEYFQDKPNGRLFYEGEVLFNYFDDNMKISVFGLGSNTPNTGFSYREASRFGLTNEMTGRYQSFINPSRLNGLPENYKGGFYFLDKLGKEKKVEIGVNYTYNDARLTRDQMRNAEHFFVDSSYTKKDTLHEFQKRLSHTINMHLDWEINDKTKLSLKSNLVMSKEEKNKNNSSNFFLEENKRFSATKVDNEMAADGLETNVELALEKEFDKRFRELDVKYQFGYTQTDRETKLKSQMYFLQFKTPDSTINQLRGVNNHTTGHRLLVDYTEPITRQFRLKLQYRLDYFYGLQKTSTYNRTPTGYDKFANLYSNDFSNDRLENRGAVGLYFVNHHQTIEAGTRFRNVEINNLNNQTGENILQNVNNWLPYLEYTYKFSNAHRLHFRYTTKSDQPSLDQLQPVRDNRNPNSLVIGNPNLTPDYSQMLTLRYNRWNAIKQSFIYAGAYFNYTNNAFSNAITYLPNGYTISKAINVDGNIYSGFYGGTGFAIFNKVLRVRPQVSGGYTSYNTKINTQLNTTDNYNIDGGLTLSVRSDTINASISAKYSYNYPKSTMSLGLNEPYLVQRYEASVFFTLPFRFEIESEVEYVINSRRVEGYNAQPFVWNAKLKRRFLKTGNLLIHLDVYDIFNQNVGISRNVGTNIITDVKSRIIARYFMIGATLRFNNNNTKVDDGRGHFF